MYKTNDYINSELGRH